MAVVGHQQVGAVDLAAFKGGVNAQRRPDALAQNVVHHLTGGQLQRHAQHAVGVVIIVEGADDAGGGAGEAAVVQLGLHGRVITGHIVAVADDGGGMVQKRADGDGNVGIGGVSDGAAAPVGLNTGVQLHDILRFQRHGGHAYRHLGDGGDTNFVVGGHGGGVLCGPAVGIGVGHFAVLNNGHLQTDGAVLFGGGIHSGLQRFVIGTAGAGNISAA